MAGAEKLIEKILADAQVDAEKLWQDAENKKSALHDELMRDIDKQKARIEKEAGAAAEERTRRMAAVADLEYRKMLLAAKQEMMQKAKDLALEKLASLDDAQYTSLMKNRLLECAKSGEGEIAVSKKEKKLDEAFLKEVNNELKSTTGKGNITFHPEKRDMLGGFIYIDGGMEINMSLVALLNESWQASETDVAGVLFESEV